MLASLFSNKEFLLSQGKEFRNGQLEKVLQGNVNNWIPDLMPDIDGYIASYKEMIFSLARHYSSFAERNGKYIWGMKMPEWNPSGLVMMQKLMPEMKIIYIERDLEACVRSAKKIQMVVSLNEIQQFCQTWKQFSHYTKSQFREENILYVKYEDLINEPEKWIKEIESFTGAKNIDLGVMERKINTYSNDHKLEVNADSYLSPAELNEEEIVLVSSFIKSVNIYS